MPPDTVEFALGWKKALLTLLLVLPMPVMWMILFPRVLPDVYAIRWSGVIPLVVVSALVVAYQWRARTVLTGEGIIAREVGRPWRLLGRTMIPWREVRAIDARKHGNLVYPIVHLTDGGMVRLRVPAERSYAKLAHRLGTIQRWQIEKTGADPAQITVPRRLPGPGKRRRLLLVPLSAIALVAVDLAVMVAVFANEWDEPPEVLNCPLVPPDLVQRIIPDNSGPKTLGASRPGESCQWQQARRAGQAPGASLVVAVITSSDGLNRSSHEDERVNDTAEHAIHPIPGVRGYTWARLRSGTTQAEGRAITGGYRIRVELTRYGSGLAPAAAEGQLAEVVQVLVRRLDGGRS